MSTAPDRSPSTATSARTVRVAAVQMKCVASREQNLATTVERIAEAVETHGAELVCLQELFNAPYPCQAEDHRRFDDAEPIPGPTTELLSSVARKHQIVIVASVFERRTAGLYHNSAVVLDQAGAPLGVYRKMHIPDDPGYYEKFYFTPGDRGFQNFPTRRVNVGVCICWDQWFPEAARLTALRGAELLCYPTAIGWHPEEKEAYGDTQYSAWQTMLRSHAIANGVYVVAPNRVGCEGAIEFWGGSLIVDPNGSVLAQGSHAEEEILIADCDLERIDAVRTHWPFLRDRRIDAYGDLTRRFVD